jgi:hypothetical protein
MKIIIKIVAALAIILGLMAVVTGLRVLFGSFDPGYQYFTALLVYNVIMGVASIIAGIFIWKENEKAIMFSSLIAAFHFVVLLTLVTIFYNIISAQSIGAMLFRTSAWLVFTIIIWKGKSLKKHGS